MTSDEWVEAALRELGDRLEVPAPPAGLTTAVLARLDEPAPRPARARPRLLPRLAAAAVALLAALAVAMAVSPTVRAAVVDFFTIGGVEIHYSPPPVTPTTSDVPQPGERDMSLADARDAVRFDIRVPALLGDPDSVRVIDSADGVPRVVSLRYPGARLDEFGGRISPIFEKFLDAGEVVRTGVDGAPAVWIPAPHPVVYLDELGVIHEETARLAAKTLIWEDRGLTYRLEGELTKEQAILIARTMRWGSAPR